MSVYFFSWESQLCLHPASFPKAPQLLTTLLALRGRKGLAPTEPTSLASTGNLLQDASCSGLGPGTTLPVPLPSWLHQGPASILHTPGTGNREQRLPVVPGWFLEWRGCSLLDLRTSGCGARACSSPAHFCSSCWRKRLQLISFLPLRVSLGLLGRNFLHTGRKLNRLFLRRGGGRS